MTGSCSGAIPRPPDGGRVAVDHQGFVETLEAKGLAAGTIRDIHDAAWRVFDSAVHDRVINRSPVVKIRLPALAQHDVVVPTIEEVLGLADAVDDRWRAVVVTLAGSGLRIGELLGLQVRDVDLLRQRAAWSVSGPRTGG